MNLVVGWLLPGGVYFLKKRYEQFAVCFALVAIAFGAGVALGGLDNPAQPGLFGVAAAVAEWLTGTPYLIAKIFKHSSIPIDAPAHDWGLGLLIAAGMINLLALADRD